MDLTQARDSEWPRRKPGTKRERTGCLTCRRRKKKCDLVYPICSHCRRLNLVCAHEEPRAGEVVTQRASVTSLPSLCRPPAGAVVPSRPIPSGLSGYHIDESSSLGSLRRRMLLYYTERLANLMSTNLQHNSFLSALLPMALESSALQDALVAWSASHLALRQSNFQTFALRSRCASLESLLKSISTSPSTDLTLANTLALCSMETILGNPQWFDHLQGGHQVILSAIKDGTLHRDFDTPEGRWLLRNYAYHDAMMSITLNRRPLLPYASYDMTEDSEEVDSYVGFAFTAIKSIMEISNLRVDMAESMQERHAGKLHHEEEPTSPSISFSQRAFSIEKQLNNWSYPKTDDAPLASLAETYRSATLIHLYRSIRQHLPQFSKALSERIENQVNRICDEIREMPLGCLPECTLLFPLFLAGGEAEAEAQISTIRERMVEIYENRNFENFRSALAVLEELWRLRAKGSSAEGSRKVDWPDVLHRRGWTLAIS